MFFGASGGTRFAIRDFSDYAYFSSYSDSWLKHIKKYTEQVLERFEITNKSLVAELQATMVTCCSIFWKRRFCIRY